MTRSREEIANALRETHGNISAAARRLQMSRLHLKRRIDRTADLVNLVEAEREMLLDQAERNIFNGVYDGDFGATKFVLMTLGRDRGYTR